MKMWVQGLGNQRAEDIFMAYAKSRKNHKVCTVCVDQTLPYASEYDTQYVENMERSNIHKKEDSTLNKQRQEDFKPRNHQSIWGTSTCTALQVTRP